MRIAFIKELQNKIGQKSADAETSAPHSPIRTVFPEIGQPS